jgi:type IV pilus assembly protein PilC
MATYAFEAMNSSGQEVKDEIEATTSEDAIAKIRAKGFFPPRSAKKPPKSGPEKGGRRHRHEEAQDAVRDRRRPAQTARQLHPAAFHPPGRRTAHPALASDPRAAAATGLLKAIIGGVADEVEGGGTLSDAMAKYPKAFDKLYVNMINAGEAGGVLDLILARLADFMEKPPSSKRKSSAR